MIDARSCAALICVGRGESRAVGRTRRSRQIRRGSRACHLHTPWPASMHDPRSDSVLIVSVAATLSARLAQHRMQIPLVLWLSHLPGVFLCCCVVRSSQCLSLDTFWAGLRGSGTSSQRSSGWPVGFARDKGAPLLPVHAQVGAVPFPTTAQHSSSGLPHNAQQSVS